MNSNKILQHFILYSLFFLILSASFSCEKKQSEPAQNIIDQSYLERPEYVLFQKKYRQEQKKRQNQKDFLKFFVSRNFESARTLPNAFTIDDAVINKSLGQESIKNPRGPDSYYVVGKVPLNNFWLFIFIQNRFSAYQNRILVGVTVREGEILDVKPLASFRNNLTEHMKSHLKIVSQQNVSIQIQHEVEYPTPHKIETTHNFPITENGAILFGDINGMDVSAINKLQYGFKF